jgi:mRNA-degrading endonuclease RelE of RelBE toxin-antitoxin system
MNYDIVIHEIFYKELKPLAKKYPSIKNDILIISENIEKELILATDLGDGFKKIRINIKSKGKGASGGGRIISYETIVSVDETKILFATIYNKGDYNNIDLNVLKKNLGI